MGKRTINQATARIKRPCLFSSLGACCQWQRPYQSKGMVGCTPSAVKGWHQMSKPEHKKRATEEAAWIEPLRGVKGQVIPVHRHAKFHSFGAANPAAL